jgi:ABC-type thiamine transport system ATPase subunit
VHEARHRVPGLLVSINAGMFRMTATSQREMGWADEMLCVLYCDEEAFRHMAITKQIRIAIRPSLKLSNVS